MKWKFGGINSDFQLQEENKFYHQHVPEINENNILLCDNDNHRKPIEFSRVVKYQFNMSENSAIPGWESGWNRRQTAHFVEFESRDGLYIRLRNYTQ